MPSRDSAGVSRTQLSSGTWAAVPPSARCCSGDSWKSWYEPSSADVIRAGLAPILLCATAAGNQRMVVDGSETRSEGWAHLRWRLGCWRISPRCSKCRHTPRVISGGEPPGSGGRANAASGASSAFVGLRALIVHAWKHTRPLQHTTLRTGEVRRGAHLEQQHRVRRLLEPAAG